MAGRILDIREKIHEAISPDNIELNPLIDHSIAQIDFIVGIGHLHPFEFSTMDPVDKYRKLAAKV